MKREAYTTDRSWDSGVSLDDFEDFCPLAVRHRSIGILDTGDGCWRTSWNYDGDFESNFICEISSRPQCSNANR